MKISELLFSKLFMILFTCCAWFLGLSPQISQSGRILCFLITVCWIVYFLSYAYRRISLFVKIFGWAFLFMAVLYLGTKLFHLPYDLTILAVFLYPPFGGLPLQNRPELLMTLISIYWVIVLGICYRDRLLRLKQ